MEELSLSNGTWQGIYEAEWSDLFWEKCGRSWKFRQLQGNVAGQVGWRLELRR